MTQRCLISVIVPVYNGEQYVAACLENLLRQSYPHLEIIVVDDGSTDRSAEIALRYPVKLVRMDENKGLSVARNTGIDTASGVYVHFMDVDDSINKEYYQLMVEAIVETGADIACGGMVNQKHSYKTQRFKKQSIYTGVQDKLRVTYVGKWGYVWRYLFRLDFLKQQQLRFEEGRFIEDIMFSLPAVYYANKLVVVPDTEYMYCNQGNSIMNKREKTHLEKERQDWAHAKALRKAFAREHGIRIPGVDQGRLLYLLRKIFPRIWPAPKG